MCFAHAPEDAVLGEVLLPALAAHVEGEGLVAEVALAGSGAGVSAQHMVPTTRGGRQGEAAGGSGPGGRGVRAPTTRPSTSSPPARAGAARQRLVGFETRPLARMLGMQKERGRWGSEPPDRRARGLGRPGGSSSLRGRRFCQATAPKNPEARGHASPGEASTPAGEPSLQTASASYSVSQGWSSMVAAPAAERVAQCGEVSAWGSHVGAFHPEIVQMGGNDRHFAPGVPGWMVSVGEP